MQRVLQRIYFIVGIGCILYFVIFSFSSRFGLSMSWIWPLAGVVFLAAAAFCGWSRTPRWLRLTWRGLLCLGAALLIFLESLVISGMFQTAPANLDYLIILGARVDPDGPSPALRRRLNAALAYLEDSPDTIVIASGGQGADEPMSEAECIRDELVKSGVSPERILLEDQSTSTAENIAFSAALMSHPQASVGIITNNYHVFRAVRIAQQAGLTNAHGIAATYTGFTLIHYMVREAACIVVDFLRGNL